MGAVTIVLKGGELALQKEIFPLQICGKVYHKVCHNVCDKVCATKCVRQSVSDKVCAAKCVRQSVQQSARQGVRQSVRQSVLNIHLHTKAKGVQYTTDTVCDKGATYIQRQGSFMH